MGPERVGGLPDEPRKSRQGVPFDNPGLRTKGGPPDGSRKGWGSQMSPERVQAELSRLTTPVSGLRVDPQMGPERVGAPR
jgi:hypothetical protein